MSYLEELRALKAEVRELKDKEEIRELLYRYNRAIDRMDEELLFSCYHEDATTDHRPFYKGDIPGFVKYVMTGLSEHFVRTYYNTGNILITLDGDKARCESYIFAPKIMKGQQEVWLVAARFLDKLERRNGEWRLSHRILVNEWEAFSPIKPTPEANQNPALDEHVPKRGGREDISYNY